MTGLGLESTSKLKLESIINEVEQTPWEHQVQKVTQALYLYLVLFPYIQSVGYIDDLRHFYLKWDLEDYQMQCSSNAPPHWSLPRNI